MSLARLALVVALAHLAVAACLALDEEPPPGLGQQECRSAVCNDRGVCRCQGWALPGPDAGADGP